MTQQEQNVLLFENELAASRQKLNRLIQELHLPFDENTGKIVQDKIALMAAELRHMEAQLQILKSSLETDGAQNHAAPVIPEESPKPQAVRPMQQPGPGGKANLEDVFGRNLMGVFASVLIFIGMILFGMIVVPALSEKMKIFCMYLVSFSVTAAGVALMKKSPRNKFFVSLAGLGVGGLFLSLMMSNVYFHLFGDLLTYILLLGWAAGTIVLSRFERKCSGAGAKINVFGIIGQLGVMISVVMGCALCAKEEDSVKFFMLTAYHFIAVAAFHCGIGGLSRNGDGVLVFSRNYRAQNHVFKLLTIWILVLSYILYIKTPNSSYAMMTMAEFLITLVLFLTAAADLWTAYKEEKTTGFGCAWYHGLMGAYALSGVMLFLQYGAFRLPEILLSCALCAALLLLVESRAGRYKAAAQIPLFLTAFLLLLGIRASAGILYILLGTIPLMAVGAWRNNRTYFIAGTASVYLWAFGCFFVYPVTFQTAAAVTACTVAYLWFRNKTEERAVRIAGYPIILLAAAVIFSTFLADALFPAGHGIRHLKGIAAFSIAGVFHIFMTRKHQFAGRNEKIMARVINALLMFLGCDAISCHEIPLLPIVIAVGVFTVNSGEILAEAEERGGNDRRKYWVMAYIMLKYTILLMVILNSFDTPGFLISIALLVFAVVSVVSGFLKRKKGYRLYGLVLSMVSIFKLVMVDAGMEDTVTGAASFLLCGLLCFAISFLYNKIQKEYFDD